MNDAPGTAATDVFYCFLCDHEITSERARISVNGSAKHVFTNPDGIVFQLGCFAAATGCAQTGTPTEEHTWFAGYNWRFALCANCHTHLGWLYSNEDDSTFYGLILDRIVSIYGSSRN